MSCFGNFLWFVFAGFWQGIGWLLVGALWCVTIVGIPVGVQCFKMAKLAFFPFGKEVIFRWCATRQEDNEKIETFCIAALQK